jgi:hypothetical protein
MAIIDKVGGCAVAVFAVLVGSAAFGQAQSSNQQKCINTLNKDTAKVAATQGKNDSGCVKSATKGSPSATCVPSDGSGKVAAVEAKAASDETKNGCLGANAPSFGYAGVTAGTTAAVAAEVNLFFDTYGTTSTVGVISTAKVDAKCQSAVTKDLEKIIATKWKQYVSCKKNTLKNGATSAAALEACLSGDPNSIAADPKQKISKAVTKLSGDIGRDCGTSAAIVSIAADFPGGCSGSTTGTLAGCLDTKAECRICLALNATDGLSEDCELFDDGVANGSCLCPAGGEAVGGACWYLGAGGQSCDQVCNGLGKTCGPATASFAGSGGTDAQCSGVLTALGVADPYYGCTTCFPGDLGCIDNPSAAYRCDSVPTTCGQSSPDTRRVCACF